MARSGFDERFGYVRWLLHLARGYEPGWQEIADKLSDYLKRRDEERIPGQTVAGWATRKSFPNSRDMARALPAVLGAEEAWLIDGNGEPPRPELWDAWIRARSHPVRTFGIESLVAAQPAKAARSRANGG